MLEVGSRKVKKLAGDHIARQFIGGTLGMSDINLLIDILLMNDSRSCQRRGQG